MKSKRTIAILLTVGMLLGLLPAAAFAEETVPAVVEGLAVCETCGEDPCVCEEVPPVQEETEVPEEEPSLEPETPETEEAETPETEAPGTETEKPEEEGGEPEPQEPEAGSSEEEPMTALTLLEETVDWEAPEITISTAEELKELARLVNEGKDFNKQTISLNGDLNLSQESWTPIGGSGKPFKGIFDGGEYVIFDLRVENSGADYQGLFGYIASPAVIKNVTLENPTVTGRKYTGALIGSAFTGTVENCRVTGDIAVTGTQFVGGLAGHGGYVRLSGCSVEGDEGSYVTGTSDNVGGLAGFRGEGKGITTANCSVSGLTVTGLREVGGMLGSSYQDARIEGCRVQNVKVVSTASGFLVSLYATKAGIGGLVGVFIESNEYVGGSMTDCGVEDITLECNEKIKAGYLSSGVRGSTETVIPNMTVEKVDITGNNSGSTVTLNSPILSGDVVQDENSVARVDGKIYDSLAAAFAAANAAGGDGQVTIVLLKDCEPTANEQLRLIRDNVVLEGGNFTIDCGGFSCSGQAGVLVSGDNVTVKNLKITYTGDNGNVSALKATKVDDNGTELVTGLVLENLTLESKGHGLNLHGVENATVTNVTANGGKCGLALANAKDVTVSGSNLTGGWGSIGMMYKANDPAYTNPVTLTLGEGNAYTGVIYSERPTEEKDTVTVAAAQAVDIAGALVKGSENLTTNAPVKIEREDGVIYYASLQSAVSAAQDGDVVTVLKDINEDVTLPLRSITLTSQGESKPVLTGKIDFAAGAMPEGAQVTIENLAFVNTRIMLIAWSKTTNLDKMGGLTIRNNTFTGTPSEGSSIYAIHINNGDVAVNNLTITGNVFTNCGTGAGGCVYATACGELVVTDNEFRNSAMNALTLTGKDSASHATTSATIVNNVFDGWAATPADRSDGRAMRLSNFDCDVDLTENSFVSSNLPEEYIKLTGLATGKKADVDKCYWGGEAPADDKLQGVDPVLSYYEDEAMTKLVVGPGVAAEVNGEYYASLQEAVNVGGKVTLLRDVTESVTVSGTVTLTIPENVTLTNTEGQHTITVVDGGNLTIEGSGTVDNVSHGKQAVYNSKSGSQSGTGVVTLNGCTYTRSADFCNWNTESDLDDWKQNSGYVIVNHGAKMTINAGVKVLLGEKSRNHSSLVTNGYMFNGEGAPEMEINGGEFTGGRHTINNDHSGTLTINGGTFTMGDRLEGQDDNVGAQTVLRNEDEAKAIITGGTFNGNVVNNNTENDSLVISGGTFTADVTGYLAEGLIQNSSGTVVTRPSSGGSSSGGSSRPSRPSQPEEDLGENDVPLTQPLPFADVAEEDWFYDAVRFVFDRDMMKGTGDGTVFQPGMTTTRGMIVTILYRLEGEPEAAGAVFADVDGDAWYAAAVNWAAANGVVKGYEDGTFRPEGIITREETAAILSRYATLKGYDKTAQGNMELYDDKTLISDWAREDMTWAVGAGLLKGKENGLLDPRGNTSRAEAAQVLMNFCQGLESK